MAIITAIGAGQMASALSIPLRENGHEVRLVGTMLDRDIISHGKETGFHNTLKRQLPPGVRWYQLEELQEALLKTDLILGGVSSFGVDWFRETIIPQLPAEIPILSVTKGMLDGDSGSLTPYPILYERQHPHHTFLAIGGPCTSYELADKDPTQVCFCGWDVEALRMAKALFETPYYHISLSTDVIGVECAVAMKNAYALGVSLAVGLAERQGDVLHYNSQAALFGQSVREMRRLLARLGGGDDNIVYGAGDLYVTIFGGRTRRIGSLLGRGLSFDEAMKELAGVTLESVVIAGRTAKAVRQWIRLGEAKETDYPLLLHVDDIITNGAPVDIPWAAFETETL